MNIVKRDGFEFQFDADGVARVRDVDVAERLGMARPRDIRRTIAGLIEAGELSDVITRAVSARVIAKGGATREQPVIEYWLDKRQAYHVAVLGKTKEAVEFRKRVLDVYIDPVTELAEVLRWTAPHDTVRAVRCPQTMRVGEVVRLDASGLEVVG